MSSSTDPASAGTKVIAFLNQKGGVGKTTSTVNIGAAMAEAGQRVCLVDMDPQSHLSLHLGIDGETVGDTVYELMLDPEVGLDDVLVKVRPNLVCAPSRIDLAALESELVSHSDRHQRLIQKFTPVLSEYDYILLDCPPSLGLLTLNALALAQEVIVPMQGHFLAMQGVGKLLETVGLVSQGVNPDLQVSGVVLCMYEKQSTHVREVVTELDEFFDEYRGSDAPWADAKVLRPAIRKNIKLAEAPSFGQTIFDYAPWCPGAIDYRTLAERLIADRTPGSGTDSEPVADETSVVDRERAEAARVQAEVEARVKAEMEAKAAADAKAKAAADAKAKAKAEAETKAAAKAKAASDAKAKAKAEAEKKAAAKAKTAAKAKASAKAKAAAKARAEKKARAEDEARAAGDSDAGHVEVEAPTNTVDESAPVVETKPVVQGEPDSFEAGTLAAEPRQAAESEDEDGS